MAKTGVSAAVGTLGDIAVSAINNHYMKQQWNREVQQEQRTYDRNRADYLYDLQQERRYNSPSEQLARLREAGLNPNLMSEGALSTGVSSGAQTMGNGTMTGIAPAAVGNGLGSGMIAMSTADVTRSRADAQNALDYATADLQTKLGVSEDEFRPLKLRLLKAQEAKENGQKAVFDKQVAKLTEETAILLIDKKNAQGIADATINQLKAQHDMFTAQGQLATAKKMTEAIVQDYQRVQRDWAKVNQWKDLVLGALGVVGQFVSAGASWKIAMNMASKVLPEKDRGAFMDMFDDMLEQTIPQYNVSPFPDDQGYGSYPMLGR